MNFKKATIIKNGIEFILINPEMDIKIETLCDLFGQNTIKVNYLGFGQFNIEAINNNEEYFSLIDSFFDLKWEEFSI
ncbi:hypothetical protein QWY31_09500 [Cytophagales bacterium LB-30]|uniref:Uncharacterized protein n=1 Tax=Shiella aurantiaca TaxID=3058365 RepID=A0ABT8F5N2_9BACT|nr:hypothetical protein [Shiella aurantiaca]MDN4165737.1 hypothetical protein [Shiella aurantiaca]